LARIIRVLYCGGAFDCDVCEILYDYRLQGDITAGVDPHTVLINVTRCASIGLTQVAV
jgi:hypothetical protein